MKDRKETSWISPAARNLMQIKSTSLLCQLAMAASCLSCVGVAHSADQMICREDAVPAGAAEVHANQLLFRDCPQIGDLDFMGKTDGKKYYSGVWFGKPNDQSFYEQADDGLLIKRGALVAA